MLRICLLRIIRFVLLHKLVTPQETSTTSSRLTRSPCQTLWMLVQHFDLEGHWFLYYLQQEAHLVPHQTDNFNIHDESNNSHCMPHRLLNHETSLLS